MVSSLRNHIYNLLLKASGSSRKNELLPAVLNSYFTSDFVDGKFMLKVPEKSLQSLLGLTDIISKLKLREVDQITKVYKKNYFGDTFYVFDVSKHEFIHEVLSRTEESVSSNSENNDDTVLVEYSSPNIAKPFHLGHLRSTVVGQFVANVLSKSHKIVRINYLGDWGTQFGLVQAGLESMSLDVNNLTENPLRIINNAYVFANKDEKLISRAKTISSTLERVKSSKEFDVWKKLRELTIKHLQETYKILGIKYDEYTWESQYASGFDTVLEKMKSKKLFEEIDQQLVVLRGEKRIPLMKSDGTSLYLSRDILAALDRYNRYKCSSIKYVIDKSQEDHVDAVKHVVSMLTGSDIVDHVKFGKIIGMSTRKGSSIYLTDILEKATKIMAENQDKSPNTRNRSFEVTQTLAITELVVYMLKQRRTKDFNFDWEIALQSKGDTGVKLQYTHSRLCSLEKNCGVDLPSTCSPEFFTEPDALKLINLLDRYDQIVSESERTLESSYMVNYLFKLSNATSLCLKKLAIKGENIDLAQQRLLLFKQVRTKLKSGMSILGLKPLDSM